MEIKIKKLRPEAIIPQRVTKGSAAYDAFIPNEIKLRYGKQIIPLGWACSMPISLEMNSRTRAGYAAKGLLVHIKGVEIRIDADVRLGLIDSDYRDEVGVIIDVKDPVAYLNDVFLHRGQALGQIEFVQVPETNFVEVDELDETERIGGFGKQNGE